MVSKRNINTFLKENQAHNFTHLISTKAIQIYLISLFMVSCFSFNLVSAVSQTNDQVHANLLQEEPSQKACINSLYGVCFGPYMDGQDPTKNGSINETQIRDRLSVVNSSVKWIRTYSCTQGLEKIGSIAHEMGLKTAIGAWIDNNASRNKNEIENLIKIGKSNEADVLIVGNEALLRGDVTEDQLDEYIKQVKTAVPNMTVTTVEPYAIWLRHPGLVDYVDSVFINLYPFHDGIGIDKELTYAQIKYQEIQEISKGKPVVISETGFPSEGDKKGAAEPSLENANRYFYEINKWSENENIPVFYFELYDEKWKETNGPKSEAHMGILNSDGTKKLSISVVR